MTSLIAHTPHATFHTYPGHTAGNHHLLHTALMMPALTFKCVVAVKARDRSRLIDQPTCCSYRCSSLPTLAGELKQQWWFIIIAVLLLFVICGIIGALKGKEVVHVINDAAQPSAGGVDSNPAVGLHDQPHNAAESASASPAASAVSPGGSVAGFPIFGGTADFGPGVPPPGYSPVSVDRRKREPANEDRHVDTPEPHEHPVLGETEQEQEEDQVQQQGVHIVNERDEAIDGEDAQGREARSRDDIDVKTSAHGVQDRDVQKHAPPSEGDLHQRAVHPETDSSANGETEKDKRSGFIGIEHIGTPSSSTVGSKRRRRNHHVGDEAGISSDPTPSPGRVEANDAKTEAVMKPNATSKGPLKPRSTPKKPACLRRRGRGKKRRGRALGGKFGRRGAEGKKWFISR